MGLVSKKLSIGCSGWSYQDWVGPFYPRDAKPADYLGMYSKVFNAVEIDSSYYRTPSPFMVSNWKRVTPEGFLFTAKFPKKITHELKLRDSQAQLERFYKAMSELATSDVAYLRMVGDRSITNFGGKQRDQGEVMRKWYTALEEKSSLFKQGFIFFNNHFAGFGPGSVNEFRRLAGLAELDWKELSREPGPLQSSMAEFQK